MPDAPSREPLLPQESERRDIHNVLTLEKLRQYPIRTLEYPMGIAKVGEVFYAVPNGTQEVDLYSMAGEKAATVAVDYAHPTQEEIKTYPIVTMQRNIPLNVYAGEVFYAAPHSNASNYSLYRMNGKYAGTLARDLFEARQ